MKGGKKSLFSAPISKSTQALPPGDELLPPGDNPIAVNKYYYYY